MERLLSPRLGENRPPSRYSARMGGGPLRICLGVEPAWLQGDVPGGEELLYGDKEIALRVELIYNLKGGLYAGGEDVVHQNDRPVPGMGDHMFYFPGSVLIPPVLWVDGPEDNGTAGIFSNGIVSEAVRGAEQKAIVAQQVGEDLPGGGHLGVKVSFGEPCELHMVKGVDADLMPLGVHTEDEVLVVFDLGADQEKGGLHAPLGQAVQQGAGGGAPGTIVKGEGDELLPPGDAAGRILLNLSPGVGPPEPSRAPDVPCVGT